jgi:catechol 2,3-dioxygenase
MRARQLLKGVYVATQRQASRPVAYCRHLVTTLLSLPMEPLPPLPADVKVGHIHLKVSDLERSLIFYRDILGFTVTQRYGTEAVFLSAGGYHHHIGLNTWESKGGSAPPSRATGLYHVAFLYPARRDLAVALQRLRNAGVPLEGAADHGVSEALYLRDPDGNGVELYWDRPKSAWPISVAGELEMVTHPLDMNSLLHELEA